MKIWDTKYLQFRQLRKVRQKCRQSVFRYSGLGQIKQVQSFQPSRTRIRAHKHTAIGKIRSRDRHPHHIDAMLSQRYHGVVCDRSARGEINCSQTGALFFV